MTEAKHHDKDDDSSRRPCCDDDSKREGWVSHVTGANFGENFSDHLYTGNLQQGSFIKISCNPDARSSNSQLLLLISILCWGDTQKLLPWLNNSPYRLPGASVQSGSSHSTWFFSRHIETLKLSVYSTCQLYYLLYLHTFKSNNHLWALGRAKFTTGSISGCLLDRKTDSDYSYQFTLNRYADKQPPY